MRSLWRFLSASMALMLGGCASTGNPPDPETSVCGWLKEPFVFMMWSRLAGKPDPARAEAVPNAVATTYRTRDGRVLRGYKLASTAGAATDTLLVAQGNAMLADQLLASLSGFADAGLDVYIFDYRGYGASDGRRRLQAIVGDYREMADALVAPAGGKRLLYGISFGGVVMLNVIGAGAKFDRAVIDSTPSRISGLGCPARYDPVDNLPQDASRMLLVAGERDTVVPVRDSAELVSRGATHGAHTEVRADYAHPFMDRDGEIRRARFELIRDFLIDD